MTTHPTFTTIKSLLDKGEFTEATVVPVLERMVEELQHELDKSHEISEAMTDYAGNEAAVILEMVALKRERDELKAEINRLKEKYENKNTH
jgi:uncharacterized coiled-coil DUF342 family protein